MQRIEVSVMINRPIEEVFAFAASPENDLQWQSGLLESEQTSEGPMDVGTTLRQVHKFLGRRIEMDFEVTEYEPNRKASFKNTSGPVQVEASDIFEPVEGGTKLTVVIQGETGGFFKLADPIVARMLKRQTEADLGNLKDLLEAQTAGSA
ncbi:MAG: SRPBCC family protein [Candidatus Bipolaricaulia bacterium]